MFNRCYLINIILYWMFVKFYDISDSELVYSVVCFECK